VATNRRQNAAAAADNGRMDAWLQAGFAEIMSTTTASVKYYKLHIAVTRLWMKCHRT